MDLSTITRTDSFKNFITISFPGYVALWPFVYLFIMEHNIDFSSFQLIIFVGYTILAAGLGILIEDLGGHLEQVFEKRVDSQDSMYYYWRKYLMYKSSHNSEDFIMLKYISVIVVRLKVELGLLLAIIIMLIGQIWVENSKYPILPDGCFTLSYFSIFIALLIYLRWESKHSIKTLHKCRKRLIDFIETNASLDVFSDSYKNNNLSNFKK